jgi:GntR family transcriptional regulator/MocR family aminotransferase
MWQHLIKLSKGLDESLQLQLRKALTNLILEHRISLDTPLPSSRDLARMLSISRSTVTLAYQRLGDEGYLLSHERQGYFVNPKMTNTLPFKEDMTTDLSIPRTDWGKRLKYKLTAQRNISKPIDWYHYSYPFIFGQVDAELMPLTEWRECWRQSQGARSITRGGYDLLDQDDTSLIEQLLRRVLPGRGIWCYAENILVTLGAQNALSMIIKLLIKADTVVGFENPGYPDARHLFELETNHIRLLEVDDEGLIISDEINACDYLYLTPAFQSPTTATLSPMRRKQLFEKAKEHNIII